MMVGGTIQDVYMFEDRLSLLVRGTGCESSDLRCIDVTLDAAREGVSRGDTIWWQADIALWTPHQGPPREDVHLERIGFSYDPKYLWPRVAELCRRGICPECGNDQHCMHDGEGALWCPRCGASLMMNEEDPLWYGPDDYERCDMCHGDGGWWQCRNSDKHPKQQK